MGPVAPSTENLQKTRVQLLAPADDLTTIWPVSLPLSPTRPTKWMDPLQSPQRATEAAPAQWCLFLTQGP